ncbi:hypothetical protein [Zavarzinia sp. CC-PAN008]
MSTPVVLLIILMGLLGVGFARGRRRPVRIRNAAEASPTIAPPAPTIEA